MITHYFEFDEKLDLLAHQVLAMCNAFEWRHTKITCYSDFAYLKVRTEGQTVGVRFTSETEPLPFKLVIDGVRFHITDALQFGKIMQAYIDRTI